MVAPTLPQGATIADVIKKLDKPESYLRGLLENMHSFEADHGPAIVRIGTTGRGSAPHYRIEPKTADTEEGFPDYFDAWLENMEAFYVAFNGRSHKKLDWGMRQLKGKSWSESGLDFDQVQTLLGDLRGFKKNRI